MIEYITSDRIANAIRQDKSFTGSYILVEGKNDLVFFNKFVNKQNARVQMAFGKERIFDAITKLLKTNYSSAIGIIDADFNHLIGFKDKPQNIFFTDNHDLEMMGFDSPAFDTLLDKHAVVEKLNKFSADNEGLDIKSIIVKLIRPLGYLKLANLTHEWGLCFKPKQQDGPILKLENFVPWNTMCFSSYEEMIKTVFNYSRGKAKFLVTEKEVLEKVKSVVDESLPDSQLVNGHDFSYVFGLALRKKIASLASRAVSSEELEADLILAYDSMHFKTSKLYVSLKRWEESSALKVFSI